MKDLLRAQVMELLEGKGAHAPFSEAAQDFPVKLRGAKPHGAPHTAWQLLEHLRIALWDMLEFSRNPSHVSPKWPDEYWPKEDAPPSEQAWDDSVALYETHIRDFLAMGRDPKRDLLEAHPPGSGKSLLRNVLVIADHNAYHVGQLMYLRRMLGA